MFIINYIPMTGLFMTALFVTVPYFNYVKVENLISNGVTQTEFTQLLDIQKASNNFQDEAVAFDNEGDLVTLIQKDDLQIEYVRRSRRPSEIKSAVITKRSETEIEVAKLFKNS